MENASKALIIAGAILLSILIIGLGMFIYNQAASAMNGANLDSQKVQAYNSEFEQYEGFISGTKARALCDAVRAHNNANLSDETLQISVDTGDASKKTAADKDKTSAASINQFKAKLKAGSMYNITFGYDISTGYIVAVGIGTGNS